jgi:hypothetical protein
MNSKEWICVKCGHQVVTMSEEKPQSMKWSDDHVCNFVQLTEKCMLLRFTYDKGDDHDKRTV